MPHLARPADVTSPVWFSASSAMSASGMSAPYAPSASAAFASAPPLPRASALSPYAHPPAPLPPYDEPLTSAPLDIEAALRGKPLKVLFLAAEGVPFVKTGGPADVIGALPRVMRRLGHDVRVVLPCYKVVDSSRWHLRTVAEDVPVPFGDGIERVRVLETSEQDGVRVYFVDQPHYFQREKLYGYNDDGDRFILFCRAALELLHTLEWAPDIIHCHDWHTAIVPNWMKSLYRDDRLFANAATVFTIHNLGYQGIFGYRILEVAGIAQEGFVFPEVAEMANMVDLMGRGIVFADAVSTVSPRYAREILTPEFGERLDPVLRQRKDRLYGILNGLDTEQFDPASDPHIAERFDAFSLERRPRNRADLRERMDLPDAAHVPVFGIISRLSDQKGFDLLDQMVIPLLEQGVQLIVAGTGDQHYHQMLHRLADRYPRQVATSLTFDSETSRRIVAGADMLLMPSRTEPCGTTQMLAMRYGCIPIVHRTGGLADTVQEFDPVSEGGNGFNFWRYDPFDFFSAIARATQTFKFPAIWHDLQQRAMLADYSWDASAEQYVALYRRAQELRRISADRPLPNANASTALA